jgi:hypothetical protein
MRFNGWYEAYVEKEDRALGQHVFGNPDSDQLRLRFANGRFPGAR